MKYAFASFAAVLVLVLVNVSGVRAEDAKAKPQVADGTIHSVDAKAKSFVLGGRNESQTTFRVAVEAEGNKEAAHVILDSKRTTFDEAIKAGRKASVTFVKVADNDLWVWKVEVTSAAK